MKMGTEKGPGELSCVKAQESSPGPTVVEAARIELASDVVLPGLLRAQHCFRASQSQRPSPVQVACGYPVDSAAKSVADTLTASVPTSGYLADVRQPER